VKSRPLALQVAALGCLFLALPLPPPDFPDIEQTAGSGIALLAGALLAIFVIGFLYSAWQFWIGEAARVRSASRVALFLAGFSLLGDLGTIGESLRTVSYLDVWMEDYALVDVMHELTEPALGALRIAAAVLVIVCLCVPAVRRSISTRASL
jgi:hypothetical protein